MNSPYVPKLAALNQFPRFEIDPMTLRENTGVSFQQMAGQVISGLNETASKPDALLEELMRGGNVDVHDVMIANSEAELSISSVSNTLTKVLQAYDRILQIQI